MEEKKMEQTKLEGNRLEEGKLGGNKQEGTKLEEIKLDKLMVNKPVENKMELSKIQEDKLDEISIEEDAINTVKKYTYADLIEMDDNNRYEIIDGNLYLISSPKMKHQAIVGEIYAQLRDFSRRKKCKPFIAPLDVVLSKTKQNNKILNVIQPDVFVIYDTEKIQKDKIFGAPEFVIEILSPSSRKQDQFSKLNLYQKYQVKEYWVIDPLEMLALPYVLNERGVYEIEKAYDLREEIPVKTLEGCKVSLREFIEENREWLDTTRNTQMVEE